MKTTPKTLTQPENTYWHFLREERKLGYGDGRMVVAGETLTVKDEPILCKRGLHASSRALDALCLAPGSVVCLAPGSIVCLVTLGGKVLHDSDKSVGQKRTALWIFDASRLLREFACDVAESALLAERAVGREPDPRSFAAIEVMRRFITGDASEAERYAANAAARATARAAYATSSAAGDAADAAYTASRDAPSATSSAAYAAVRAISSATSSAAAYAAATVYAAAAAARAAAAAAFNEKLTTMLMAAMESGQGEFAAPGQVTSEKGAAA